MSFAEPLQNASIEVPSAPQSSKSLRNRSDYQRRRAVQMEQRMAVTQNELYCALGQVSDLEHSNKSLTNEVKYFKAEADKSNDLLTTRTKRFAAFRVRKEQEIKNAKQAAAKRILALESGVLE